MGMNLFRCDSGVTGVLCARHIILSPHKPTTHEKREEQIRHILHVSYISFVVYKAGHKDVNSLTVTVDS